MNWMEICTNDSVVTDSIALQTARLWINWRDKQKEIEGKVTVFVLTPMAIFQKETFWQLKFYYVRFFFLLAPKW